MADIEGLVRDGSSNPKKWPIALTADERAVWDAAALSFLGKIILHHKVPGRLQNGEHYVTCAVDTADKLIEARRARCVT